MDLKQLEIAINEALENQDAYLVDLEFAEGNNITVYVDADGGINLQRIKMINRQIEAAFDREVEDFSLTVSSPGLSKPLKVYRQYVNNIGRWVKVKTADNKVLIGQLKEVTPTDITLELPPVKKKDPIITQVISFENIVETKIEIRF